MAFEPSALNYGLLVEHIALNKMDKNIFPLCIAMNDETKIASLNMKSFETGHASNSIGAGANQFGAFETAFSQSVPAMTGEDFCKIFSQPVPDHIKLDVDGIEPSIIKGLEPFLSKVKTIIIEVEGENLNNVSEQIEQPIFAAGFEEDTSYRERGHKRNRLYVKK